MAKETFSKVKPAPEVPAEPVNARLFEAEHDSLIRDAERYRWIRGGNRIGVKWCELYAGGPALDEAIDSTMKAMPATVAKTRFDKAGGHEETDPIERLRFFCSQAMGGQDWLDVEPFFNDVIAEREALRNVCAEAYQLAGALDAPVEALENLSAAMMGQPLPHATFLPVEPKKTERLTEKEIRDMGRAGVFLDFNEDIARAIEAAVLRKNGIEA